MKLWAAYSPPRKSGTEGLIGQTAATGGEIVHALMQGGLHIVQRSDIHTSGGAQLLEVDRILGVFHMERLVGAEGGQHPGGKGLVLGNEPVILQIVGGIVGGTQRLHVAGGDESPGRSLRALELAVGLLPDLRGALAVQQLLCAKKAQQLQMRPVVDGISHQGGHDFRKVVELLPEGRRAGHILFRHAAGPHDAPLVVVAGQPGLSQVGELLVLVDLLGIEMAVIVEDGHVLGVLIVEAASGFAAEQEVLGNKRFHSSNPFQMKLECPDYAEKYLLLFCIVLENCPFYLGDSA